VEQIIVTVVFVAIGFFFGMSNEKNHYKSIRSREDKFKDLPAVNLKKNPYQDSQVFEQRLVIGSTVVSIDYFKLVIAGIKSLFGGRLRSYESLVDRARREAVLRMKEQAQGFSMILNIRIETSSISKGPNNKSVGSIEVLAYGTAIKVAP
jgi:uncharacterized protein YbjQ (UPF0145 family)